MPTLNSATMPDLSGAQHLQTEPQVVLQQPTNDILAGLMTPSPKL
jgi:hypothetical protein